MSIQIAIDNAVPLGITVPRHQMTFAIGELYLGPGVMVWLDTAVVGPLYSGHPLHILRGEFENPDQEDQWQFLDAESGESVASVFVIPDVSPLDKAVVDFLGWRASKWTSRDTLRAHYATMIREKFGVEIDA